MLKRIVPVVAPLLAMLLASCQAVTAPKDCRPSRTEMTTWNKALKANTPAAYKNYLSRYPNGCFASTASKRLGKKVKPVTLLSPYQPTTNWSSGTNSGNNSSTATGNTSRSRY